MLGDSSQWADDLHLFAPGDGSDHGQASRTLPATPALPSCLDRVSRPEVAESLESSLSQESHARSSQPMPEWAAPPTPQQPSQSSRSCKQEQLSKSQPLPTWAAPRTPQPKSGQSSRQVPQQNPQPHQQPQPLPPWAAPVTPLLDAKGAGMTSPSPAIDAAKSSPLSQGSLVGCPSPESCGASSDPFSDSHLPLPTWSVATGSPLRTPATSDPTPRSSSSAIQDRLDANREDLRRTTSALATVEARLLELQEVERRSRELGTSGGKKGQERGKTRPLNEEKQQQPEQPGRRRSQDSQTLVGSEPSELVSPTSAYIKPRRLSRRTMSESQYYLPSKGQSTPDRDVFPNAGQ